MAEMKHMKKPDRQPKLPREPKSPGPRTHIGRDRAFKAALAKEYGVVEVPRPMQRRIQKTLDSLPDTLPVRHRPVLRTIRSMATAAAVLAVTFAALLGINTTHPQLTEALPGLGSVFAAMNGSSTPGPMPTAEPTPRPEFQPVTVPSDGDFPGTLTIEDAWSDGRSLVLDMSLSAGDDLYSIYKQLGSWDGISLWASTMSTVEFDNDYEEEAYSITVYSDSGVLQVENGYCPAFLPQGDGIFRTSWYIDLEDLEAGEELKVDINVPDVLSHAEGGGPTYTWNPEFHSTFSLPVTKSKNRTFSLQASNGSVTLSSINYAPSKVELDVNLPYLGLIEEIMPDNGELSDWPLGFYARLSCLGPDGERFVYGTALGSPKNLTDTEPALSDRVDLRYTFTAISELMDPRKLKGPLVLTLYEFPQPYEDGFGNGKVTAEFTIDLGSGKAYPSENYLSEGYEKDSAPKTTAERLSDASYDGLLLMPSNNSLETINMGGDPLAYVVISAPSEASGRELIVNCYLEDTVYRSLSFSLGGNYEDGSDSYYTGFRYLAGREYLETSVTIGYPAYVAETMGYVPFDRIEIADPATGKVIIPDLGTALVETREKLLGEKYKEITSASSDAESGL